jgi:hypothetical protein
MSRIRTALLLLALAIPSAVFAQHLTWQIVWLFAGAPVVAVLITIVASIVSRSWKVAMMGLGSVGVWIGWYWVAAQTAERDVLFWIPLVAIHIQLTAIFGWLIWKVIEKVRSDV